MTRQIKFLSGKFGKDFKANTAAKILKEMQPQALYDKLQFFLRPVLNLIFLKKFITADFSLSGRIIKSDTA